MQTKMEVHQSSFAWQQGEVGTSKSGFRLWREKQYTGLWEKLAHRSLASLVLFPPTCPCVSCPLTDAPLSCLAYPTSSNTPLLLFPILLPPKLQVVQVFPLSSCHVTVCLPCLAQFLQILVFQKLMTWQKAQFWHKTQVLTHFALLLQNLGVPKLFKEFLNRCKIKLFPFPRLVLGNHGTVLD